MSQDKKEASYLVDNAILLHVKEQDAGFTYAAFDRQTGMPMDSGSFALFADHTAKEKLTQKPLAMACGQALERMGKESAEVAEVGLRTLENCRGSEIRGRMMFESESLPKDEIRVIDPAYNTLFYLPNGGSIQITSASDPMEAPRSARCEFLDAHHTRVGSNVFHIREMAEVFQRSNSVILPEPEINGNCEAWKMGRDQFLLVEKAESGMGSYTLYDDQLRQVQGGKMNDPQLSMKEIRDAALQDMGRSYVSLTRVDHGKLMELAAEKKDQERSDKRTSVRERLAKKPKQAERTKSPKKKAMER